MLTGTVDKPLGTIDRTGSVWQQDYEFRSGSLSLLLVMAVGYLLWQASLPDVTPNDRAYGIGGMLLGLFICSRPARNGIDVLIFERRSLRRAMRGAKGVAWLCLNALVMLAGCVVVVMGAMRMSVKIE
jgi:hypothetical protein